MRRWLAAVVAGGFGLAVVELVVLGLVIWWIGIPWTLAAVIAKAVVGYFLVRRQGGRAWRRFRDVLDAGHPPGREVTHGVVGLVAALLVMVSGFVGAALGAVALIPLVRRWAAAVVENAVERRLSPAVAGDVFGPRQVKVRRGRRTGSHDTQAPSGPAEEAADAAAGPPKAIEGEILPPA